MTYFSKHLGEGERVLMVARPSWWLVVNPLLLSLATFAVLLVVAGMLGGLAGTLAGVTVAVVSLPCLVVAALLAIPGLVTVLTTEIVLTDRRVASKRGVLSINVISTPLDKVNNINVQQGPLGRLLGYGTVEVTTATAEERDNHTVRYLAHANAFRDEVNEAIDKGV